MIRRLKMKTRAGASCWRANERTARLRKQPSSRITHQAAQVMRGAYLLLILQSLVCVNALLIGHVRAQPQANAAASFVGGQQKALPDLTSATSEAPIFANVGQTAYLSCVARNLQNYTVIWRYTNEASAPADPETPSGRLEASGSSSSSSSSSNAQQPAPKSDNELGAILTAGRQRVSSDERISIIQSHDTWLLKIKNVRLSDTGTYICHTNSEPRVRVARILSVVRPGSGQDELASDADADHFGSIDYNFTDCCRAEYVVPRCQRLCSFKQLASRYQSINIVHECYSNLPSITRCMVAGRNVTDCCQKRHIPSKCNPMCGHLGDTSAMSVQDQSYCADYSASIMSCVAEGVNSLPGQPELVIVEAVSSTTLKVSWQKVTDANELRKIDGWIINLTKLSSFEDTISSSSASAGQREPSAQTGARNNSSISVAFSSSSSSSASSASSSQTSQTTPTSDGSGSSAGQPLSGLSLVDANDAASLASMTKLLAASSGTISVKLDKRFNEFSLNTLKPYTVYQIQMFAYNSLGRSQLTDPIRALTLAPESELSPATSGGGGGGGGDSGGSDEAYVEPTLPDTRKCCLDRGVTLKRCLDTLCDPVEADRASIADLMICAPWSNVTFSCLSSRVNHTDCCKSRGVTPFCLSMCSGDVKRVDYRHFRCLTHMSTYTNCILESHNVLPSAPQNFTVGPITDTWAVLNWRAPRKNAASIQGFRIFWRRVEPAASSSSSSSSMPASSNGATTSSNSSSELRPASERAPGTELLADLGLADDYYHHSAEAATNPYLLDALQPSTVYETFAVAVNKFGQSESSARFIFQTLPEPDEAARKRPASSDNAIESRLPLAGNTRADSMAPLYYNESACCESSGVHNMCRQLCDYDLKVLDVSSLITSCSSQMPVILRCLAGSRNSVPCCRTRSVSEQCLNVCAGLTEHSPLVVATRCASDFGKIIRCMDEGSKMIPGAPIELRALEVRADRVRLSWSPAPEDEQRADIEYHVRYQRLQAGADSAPASADPSALIAVVPLHPLDHNLIMTTNSTEATIDKLRANSRYSIYVTAENPYGISLPSLVLVIQTPAESDGGGGGGDSSSASSQRQATLGAPHSLEVLRSDTDSMVLKWIAPLFISNDAQIKYRVFYKLIGQQNGTAEAAAASASSSNNDAGGVQQIASNWTVLETADTSALLRNLRYSSQYAITVQAFSKQMLGHMGEILLASTARPTPPTLNHPLVINSPIEGNNITIMCVALGQPTPTISMFINGLLVQKRTQPYVIYHLVNLVRGQLSITCFASNGHGKDYASVQSRTEVSVKFASQAQAKTKEVRVLPSLTARLSCEVSGNPQPTVVWTFQPKAEAAQVASALALAARGANMRIVQANERVSTLLVSLFESPFTWTHTLTLRNVTEADAGRYQCRAKNPLAEAADSIELSVSNKAELTQQTGAGSAPLELPSDMLECCKSQNVSAKCLPVCTLDGLDVESAFKTPECQAHIDKLMYCAADGSDHRNCCRTRQVPASCLRWCSGAKLNIPAICVLSSALDINQCFQEGRTLLPGPPRNLRIMLASDSEHGERETESAEVATMRAPVHMSMFSSQPNSSVISPMDVMMGEHQMAHATPSSASAEEPAAAAAAAVGEQQQANNRQPQQNSQPLIIEWDPPTKNAALVQYYRIFWRPAGSRELSRTVTNLTWIRLNDLNMNKQYEFVVKAANLHGSSIYSEPLTAKPSEIPSRGDLSSVGMIWFMPSSSASHLVGRIVWAVCFATLFMFTSLAAVMFLEKKGYLKRFASSKSNSSRVSFANPAYLKDSDNILDGGDNITWENGHSLDVLGLPPQTSEFNSSTSSSSSSPHNSNGPQI